MRIFEYQAKSILKEEGFPIPRSILLNESRDISKAIQEIGLPFVLKVQTLIGGRGKAGGIQIVSSYSEAEEWYKAKIGTYINGKKVESILAEEMVEIESEYYFGLTLDVKTREIKLLFSLNGGIHVEDTKDTSTLFTYTIQTEYGIDDFKIIEILSRAEVPKVRWQKLIETFHRLYNLFLQYDCILLEINPLIWSKDEQLEILDVHFYIDDNALQRQKIAQQIVVESPDIYLQAWHKIKYGFDIVILNPEGNVGLLSTGAGLSMSIIDELVMKDVNPINFADIRSGQLKGDPTRLIVILEQLKQYKNLQCIFVSIFAGITDLAEFAIALLEAKKRVLFSKKVDWVIRLEGNNFGKAKEILESNGLHVTNSLDEAIERVEQKVIV